MAEEKGTPGIVTQPESITGFLETESDTGIDTGIIFKESILIIVVSFFNTESLAGIPVESMGGWATMLPSKIK